MHAGTRTLIWAAVAAGLLLRLWSAASGDLWLDEAWSALFASLAGPVGVFVGIHHDNNHPLNSLWLALVGPTAPVLVQRGLSVVAGTCAILVAARIGARRSAAMAVALAWLFALSPLMVRWGSEARGYALVSLFLLLFLDLVDRYRREGREPGGGLAAVAALGALSHFIMLPGLAAILFWHLVTGGLREGVRANLGRFAPACGFALLMVAVVGGSALLNGGMRIGSLEPFGWAALARGLAEVTALSTGLMPFGPVSPLLATTVLALLAASLTFAPRPSRSAVILALVMGGGLPLAAALLQAPNVGFARYHLLSGMVLLLAIGWRLGTLRSRPVAQILLVGTGAAMAAQSLMLVAQAKGRPGEPVERLRALQPEGATVLIASPRTRAVLDIAARRRGYPLRIVGPACAPAKFLTGTIDRTTRLGTTVDHCGRRWSVVAAPSRGAVGWWLARDVGLASP